jgi:hypothetical protein
VRWAPREPPLAPRAAIGLGEVARALARRLLALPAEAMGRLSGVGGADVLVVMADEAALPWVDGVIYLGRDPEAPSLLLPTTLRPDVPPPLFEEAVLGRVRGTPPVVVLPEPPVLVATGAARPLDRGALEAWLA